MMAKNSDDPSMRQERRQQKADANPSDDEITSELPITRDRALLHLIESLSVFILETDARHRIIFMNDPFAQVSGYQIGQTLPFDSSEPHPYWRNPTTGEPYRWNELPIARVWQTNAAVDDAIVTRTLPSGEEVSLLAKGQSVRDAEGNITSVILTLVDISAQRHAEHVAQEHAAVLDAVIDSMRDGVAIFDPSGRLMRINPAFYRLLGWDPSSFVPFACALQERAAIYDVYTLDGQPLPFEQWPLHRILRGETVDSIQLSVRRADGSRVILDMSGRPLRHETTGEMFGAVCFFRDMTEFYRLEHMREEFINIASHELRTPLTSMGLANHLLQQWLSHLPDAELMLELNATITAQMKRMERLINNMLDLTAITGGNFHITPRPADLAKVVRAAVEEQRSLTRRDLRLSGADEALPALIDAQRINQVVTNLLNNAQANSAASTPIIVQLTQVQHDETPWARISVRDYGKGIPANRLETIFERFGTTPADADQDEADDSVNGLRFGLFLARAVVEEHGGNIHVESQPGRGSIFTFEIPLNPPQERVQ